MLNQNSIGNKFKLKVGEDVILSEPLDWCKLFVDNKLKGKLILNVSA
jgi:hypothetical protein